MLPIAKSFDKGKCLYIDIEFYLFNYSLPRCILLVPLVVKSQLGLQLKKIGWKKTF